MTFEQTLLLGSYVYATAILAWVERRVSRVTGNHLAHLRNQLQDEINELRQLQGLPPKALPNPQDDL